MFVRRRFLPAVSDDSKRSRVEISSKTKQLFFSENLKLPKSCFCHIEFHLSINHLLRTILTIDIWLTLNTRRQSLAIVIWKVDQTQPTQMPSQDIQHLSHLESSCYCVCWGDRRHYFADQILASIVAQKLMFVMWRVPINEVVGA